MRKIILFYVLILGSFFAYAQSDGDFRTASSGDWNTAATWQRFNGGSMTWVAAIAPPTNADGVITILSGHTVTITSSVTADQIVVNSGGTLSQSVDFTLNNGSGNDLTVDGNWDFISGNLFGPGNAVIGSTGVLTFSSANNKFISADIINNGTMNWQDGSLLFNAVNTVTNAAAMNISVSSPLTFGNNGGSGTFVNSGTVTMSGTGTATLSMGILNSTGSFHFNAGSVTATTAFTNSGSMVFSSGSFTNSGTLDWNAGSTVSGTGSFGNGGTLNLNTNLVFPSTLIFSSTNTIAGAGNLTINNDFTIHGTISGPGTLTINANTTFSDGTLGRDLTIGPSNSLTFNTANNKFISANITNNGAMSWQDGGLLFNTASTVTNTATMDISVSGPLTFGNNGGSGTFVNSGTVTMSGTGSATLSMGTMNSTGSFHFNAGSVTATTAFTNSGSMVFSSGSFTNSGTLNWESGATVSGSGSFGNGGTLNLNTNLVFPSTLIFSSTNTIAGAGDLTINNDFTIHGTITGPGTLTINANTTFSDGTLGRDLTIGPSNSLTFNTANNKFISANITNNGAMSWQDGGLLFNAATTVTNSGTMDISVSGLLTFGNNGGSGTFVNSGTVTMSGTGTATLSMGILNSTGSFHFNAGSVTATTAFTNSGSMVFSSGSFTNSGTLNWESGATVSGSGSFGNGGTLNLNTNLVFPSTLIFSSTNTIAGAGDLTINNDFTIHGTISGPGALTINANTTFSDGTLGRDLTIGPSNTLTFNTANNKFISANITNNGAMSWQDGGLLFNAATTVTNSGTMDISVTNPLTFGNNGGSGTFVNSGTLTMSGTGNATLSMGILNSTGAFHFNAGTVTAGANFTNSGPMVFGSGSFINNGTLNWDAGSTVSGSGSFANNAGLFNINTNVVFPSTLIFSNATNIAGAGNLTINNDFTIHGSITGPGALTINANTTFSDGTLGRDFTNGSLRTLTISSFNTKFISATITNAGTMIWQDGHLLFNTNTTLTNSGTMNVTLTGDFSFSNNAGSGTLANDGTIAINNTHIWTVNLTNFNNSNSGIIKGNGILNNTSTNFTNNGVIAPGLSPGIITLNTNEPFSANSSLNIEMQDGSGPGTGNDEVLRDGNLTLAGTIDVTEIGTVPNGTYTIISLSTGTISGSFATANLPTGYSVQVNASTVQLVRNAALPLTLIAFSAEMTTEGHAKLSWITENEVGTSHFDVERSLDGQLFQSIGTLEAKGSGAATYSFYDNTPAAITYYRLKMVDLDGKYSYSNIAVLKNSIVSNGQISIYPNPSHNRITVSGLPGQGTLKIFDMDGKLVQQIHVATLSVEVNISKLNAGFYIIRVEKTGFYFSQKFLKW